MYIYNQEHYTDLTAALAVKRVDGKRKLNTPSSGYLIGEIYRFTWDNGVMKLWLSG